MKLKFLTALCMAALTTMPSLGGSSVPGNNRLKVMTYNIRNGIGMDNVADLRRVADVISRSGADIVGVQEVDSVTGRSHGRYILGDLAHEALMYPTYAKAIDYDGGKYGIGMLSKTKPLSVKRIALPGREESRVLLVAEFDRYRVANTHLSLTEEDALSSVAILADEARSGKKPLIIMGDWNSMPGSPALEAMKKAGFTIVSGEKHATWPADNPTDCIDYIAVYDMPNSGMVALSAAVVNEPVASDHRPIIMDFGVKTPVDAMLYKEPYLQNPSHDGITVMFQTNPLADCRVEYGTDTLNLMTARELAGGQTVCHDIEHRIRLRNLVPGKKYFYRVKAREILANHAYSKTFGDEYTGPFYSFTLPSDKTDSFTAIIVDDLHEYRPTISAIRRMADSIPHDLMIFNGDCLTEPGNRMHAIENIHMLADSFEMASTPAIFIRGNHEIRNAYSSGMPSLIDMPGGKTYGAMSWGDTRFVFLDCGEDKPDSTWVYYGLNDFTDLRNEQVEFLKREISSPEFRNAARRVLVHHIPIWGNTDKYKPCTELWAPLIAKAGFDVDIAGHTHAHRYHAPGSAEGNPIPVVIGGGYRLPEATMIVLKKNGRSMTVDVLDMNGNTIRHLDL